ncbi:5'-nucleotidase C-terminal domain-containing protein [Flavobacterium rhizosphaerae]|uniref:5'-nucleotidase n=1 Tax=Flavobacterium rhizosphaerae TaxID=3163298 RepID=A0ABW8YV04_9FLAO
MRKKYNTYYYRIVLFLTIIILASCSSSNYKNTAITGKQININKDISPEKQIENFISPYREHINRDLDSILAYAPETFDKSQHIKGWQTTIGNLMSDVAFDKADKLLMQRENKHVDVCLLNYGGIRAIIPKGNVTARTAYEIMPFENSLLVIALKGQQITDIANYMADGRKPHPLTGMEIILDKNGNVKKVTVQGQPVQTDKIYYVATSDYLANGGDNMDFFKKAVTTYDMDYKLRNLYIDYFKEVDTLPVITTERIITE